MEPIRVPAPPKSAFNKHRRMSDLIKAQVQHLKHVEEKLPVQSRAALPKHNIVSEQDAALYIAAMTRLLSSTIPSSALGPQLVTTTSERRVPVRPKKVIAIAAVAEGIKTPPKPTKRLAKKSTSFGTKTSPDSRGNP